MYTYCLVNEDGQGRFYKILSILTGKRKIHPKRELNRGPLDLNLAHYRYPTSEVLVVVPLQYIETIANSLTDCNPFAFSRSY